VPPPTTTAIWGREDWSTTLIEALQTEAVLLASGAGRVVGAGRVIHVPRLLVDPRGKVGGDQEDCAGQVERRLPVGHPSRLVG
jgi:hypothetical protein